GPATLVDHMQTVMTESGLYEDLEKLEAYLGEYAQAKDFDPARKNVLKEQILAAIKDAKLEKELKLKENLPFEEIVRRSHEIITKIRDTQIPDGMHIFGEYPKSERKVEFIHSILRYDFGDGISCRRILFNLMNEDLDFAIENPSSMSLKHKKTYGELIKNADIFSKKLIEQFLKNEKSPEVLAKQTLKEYLKNSKSIVALSALKEKVVEIAKRIDSSKEIESLFHGFKGGYIQPGPSGLITRGRPDVLPTGRNFYSLDPEKIPTRAAWKVGVGMADALIEKHKEKTNKFPENLAMVWFCSDIMHADGEEMSQLLYLIGTRPVWQDNGKVKGFEVIPLKELKRPRIDITIRVSGITRDCFPRCIELLDEAIQAIAALPESIEDNFIRKHVLEQMNSSGKDEMSKEDWRDATLRLFTSRPGTYGSGVNLAIYASAWKEEKDLSETFIYWNGYAYGKGVYGKESHQEFIKQLSSVDLTFNKTCTDESDLFSCCCYFSVQGGMATAARHISGKEIENYYGDTRNPSHLKVVELADEIRRVVRTKVLNPKWIEGMKRHGYKGAGDISKRVGRVYGWQATTGEVDDWIFDEIAKTFVLDEEMRKFFEENNPWALEEIGRRLLEAHQRELWDADPKVLQALKDIYLEIESWLEERMGDVKGDFQGGSTDILTSSDVENWNNNVQQIQKLIEREK
ncbi:MAG: cobaltochelatase subunit CobN, partial [Candidatus Omnitrophica bacterium]|nr:cobaltochelatase subunit CobN [Candidatus Omnitrophota bacterium]